jgi:hypothetical protein
MQGWRWGMNLLRKKEQRGEKVDMIDNSISK